MLTRTIFSFCPIGNIGKIMLYFKWWYLYVQFKVLLNLKKKYLRGHLGDFLFNILFNKEVIVFWVFDFF